MSDDKQQSTVWAAAYVAHVNRGDCPAVAASNADWAVKRFLQKNWREKESQGCTTAKAVDKQ